MIKTKLTQNGVFDASKIDDKIRPKEEHFIWAQERLDDIHLLRRQMRKSRGHNVDSAQESGRGTVPESHYTVPESHDTAPVSYDTVPDSEPPHTALDSRDTPRETRFEDWAFDGRLMSDCKDCGEISFNDGEKYHTPWCSSRGG